MLSIKMNGFRKRNEDLMLIPNMINNAGDAKIKYFFKT